LFFCLNTQPANDVSCEEKEKEKPANVTLMRAQPSIRVNKVQMIAMPLDLFTGAKPGSEDRGGRLSLQATKPARTQYKNGNKTNHNVYINI
jgi:hypothetical protein